MRINAVFSMTSAVSKSNQIVRIFRYGSGNKLSTVLKIFTGQSRFSIKQKVAGFKRKTQVQINVVQTSKYQRQFLTGVRENRDLGQGVEPLPGRGWC
jgi:hypothetical protein